MQKPAFPAEEIRRQLSPLFAQYSFVRALYQEQEGLAVSANVSQTLADPLPATRGIVISVLHQGVLYEASHSLGSMADLRHLVAGLEQNLQYFASRVEKSQLGFLPEEPLTEEFSTPRGEDMPLSEKIRRARLVLSNMLAADGAIVMGQVMFRQTLIRETYISARRTLSQELSRFEGIFSAILRDEKSGQNARIYDGFARQGGWELMEPPAGMLEKMLSDGKKLLSARRLEPGFYDCIFSPSLAGILAHEAFGHGTEADMMLKGRARGSEYMGKAVAAPQVGLYDSPALEKQAASYFFDHEGQLAATTRIVENGQLNQALADHRTASAMNIARTANGRRQSYDHKIYTRMSNTYFCAGNDNLADMIASIEDGYLVDRATNGMEDPKGWGIQLEALYAERIHHGQLTGEVFSPVIVTGYVPDILQSVSMVSEKMEINGLGMCGKGHKEWVKVTDGGPWLKLRARLA